MRWRDYLLITMLLDLGLFAVYRSQYVLYFGLVYGAVVYLEREGLKPRGSVGKARKIATLTLIALSPIFLVVKIGEFTSPTSFYALLLLGLLELYFQAPLLVRGLPIFMFVTAMLTRSVVIRHVMSVSSKAFVDVTSHLVHVLIKITGIPIGIRDNVATVGKDIVVIGFGCSGLDAFIIYILASLLLIYLRKSSRKEAVLLLLGALGIIPLNALRIFVLLTIGYYWGIPFLELFHSHLGDLMFIAYVFVYWWWVLKRSDAPSKDIGQNPARGNRFKHLPSHPQR